MIKASCLVTPLLAKLIGFEIWLVVLLRRFMMWNLMKPTVPKEDENLEDVRGTQLANAMKKWMLVI
jgi:hypothetical protein